MDLETQSSQAWLKFEFSDSSSREIQKTDYWDSVLREWVKVKIIGFYFNEKLEKMVLETQNLWE